MIIIHLVKLRTIRLFDHYMTFE